MPTPASNSHVLTGCRAQAGVSSKHKRYGLAFCAPSRESDSYVCPALVVCSTAVTLTKPCAHSPRHLVNLVTPEASLCLLLLKVTDSVCHAHWHFFAHEDKWPASAVLGSQLCVRDGRGSGLCSVKRKRKHSASPRCHGVWALVEPSFSRTQSMGWGGESARQPCRGEGEQGGDSTSIGRSRGCSPSTAAAARQPLPSTVRRAHCPILGTLHLACLCHTRIRWRCASLGAGESTGCPHGLRGRWRSDVSGFASLTDRGL